MVLASSRSCQEKTPDPFVSLGGSKERTTTAEMCDPRPAPIAQLVSEVWRRKYNEGAEHSGIGNVTSHEFILNHQHEAHVTQELTFSAVV
jgi:hypothetical protein